jgi:hypothetical protein
MLTIFQKLICKIDSYLENKNPCPFSSDALIKEPAIKPIKILLKME